MGDFEELGAFGCFAVEFDGGRAAALSDHFDFLPSDATDAEAQGFGGGFFGGKASCEAIGFASAEFQLLEGVDSAQKSIAPAFDDSLDARNLYNINASY